MSYGRDRYWSDRFIPAVKTIVGPRLLEPSNFEVDTKEATDLIILIARDMRIGARMRRKGVFDRWPYQFTIREDRDTGSETELSKIVNGWGDWLFYGHAIEDDDVRVGAWMIVNLHALRSAMIRRSIPKGMAGTNKNGDGTSFRWFDIRGFERCPIPILVASSLASA